MKFSCAAAAVLTVAFGAKHSLAVLVVPYGTSDCSAGPMYDPPVVDLTDGCISLPNSIYYVYIKCPWLGGFFNGGNEPQYYNCGTDSSCNSCSGEIRCVVLVVVRLNKYHFNVTAGPNLSYARTTWCA